MQYRHHLLTLSKGGEDDTTIYFAVWWVLFECSSFDHFPNVILNLSDDDNDSETLGKYGS